MRPAEQLGRAGRASTSVGAVILAALTPKCPLCVAAAMTAFGASSAVASLLAPVARPLVLSLAAFAVLALAVTEWRRLRRRHSAGHGSCCAVRR